ncbi:MAG: Putative ferric ion ABC transporter, partial [Synergistales bacterium 57_84]
MKVRTPRFCNFLLFLILCLSGPLSPVAAGQGPAPERIVSLAPSITESLFAIGAGDRVAGVTDHDVFPEEVRAIPSVGGYYDPSLERILALSPQLVIGIATFHGKL